MSISRQTHDRYVSLLHLDFHRSQFHLSKQKPRKEEDKVKYQPASGPSLAMVVSKTGERDKDMIYQLKRCDNNEPYYDPERRVECDEDKWWFTGDELEDEGA